MRGFNPQHPWDSQSFTQKARGGGWVSLLWRIISGAALMKDDGRVGRWGALRLPPRRFSRPWSAWGLIGTFSLSPAPISHLRARLYRKSSMKTNHFDRLAGSNASRVLRIGAFIPPFFSRGNCESIQITFVHPRCCRLCQADRALEVISRA